MPEFDFEHAVFADIIAITNNKNSVFICSFLGVIVGQRWGVNAAKDNLLNNELKKMNHELMKVNGAVA